jgi:hypothetical protein
MSKMGVSEDFIRWVKLFFGNATTAVNLNECPSSSFKVERRVRQGCPFAPYIFFIVGKALIQLITKAIAEGQLKGITLSEGKKQQNIS